MMARLTAEHIMLDLTDIPRVGFRGMDSATFLSGKGYELPGQPNRAIRQADGTLVLQLSNTEYFLLGSQIDEGARIAQEERNWTLNDTANYLLPRQDSHAWVALHGPRIAEVMAKICGVDLRPSVFPAGHIAQTQVARVTAVVANTGSEGKQRFELLFDRCSHEYFIEAVMDALSEFNGEYVVFGEDGIR